MTTNEWINLKVGDVVRLNPAAKWPNWMCDLNRAGWLEFRNVANGQTHVGAAESMPRRFPKAALRKN